MSSNQSETPSPKVLKNSLPHRGLNREEVAKIEQGGSVTSVTPLGMYPGTNLITHFGLTSGPKETILAWNPQTEYWEKIAVLEWVSSDADWETESPDTDDVTLEFSLLAGDDGVEHPFTASSDVPFEALDEFLRHHLSVVYTNIEPPTLLFDLFQALTDE